MSQHRPQAAGPAQTQASSLHRPQAVGPAQTSGSEACADLRQRVGSRALPGLNGQLLAACLQLDPASSPWSPLPYLPGLLKGLHKAQESFGKRGKKKDPLWIFMQFIGKTRQRERRKPAGVGNSERRSQIVSACLRFLRAFRPPECRPHSSPQGSVSPPLPAILQLFREGACQGTAQGLSKVLGGALKRSRGDP